ncbi:MAG: hypothetical protein Q9207_003994 [Kuettlingeria erythrocarpa]
MNPNSSGVEALLRQLQVTLNQDAVDMQNLRVTLNQNAVDTQKLRTDNAQTQAEVMLLRTQMADLQHGNSGYEAIRHPNFETAKRAGKLPGDPDEDFVRKGNRSARAGDALYDAELCSRGKVSDPELFAIIYGFGWEQVIQFSESVHNSQTWLTAINAYGTLSLENDRALTEICMTDFADFVNASRNSWMTPPNATSNTTLGRTFRRFMNGYTSNSYLVPRNPA